MTTWQAVTGATAVALLAALVTTFGQEASATVTVWDGVYTPAQAERGEQRYASACAMCHGFDMTGGGGVPGLVGPEFLFGYDNGPLAALYDYVKANMPPDQPGGLANAQYVDLVAAILKGNGFPASAERELEPDSTALARIRILRNKP